MNSISHSYQSILQVFNPKIYIYHCYIRHKYKFYFKPKSRPGSEPILDRRPRRAPRNKGSQILNSGISKTKYN